MSDTQKTDLHANLSIGSMMRASHAYEFARELERELVAMAKDRDTLRARVAELEKGEYICRKCGLRKDGEGEKGDF